MYLTYNRVNVLPIKILARSWPIGSLNTKKIGESIIVKQTLVLKIFSMIKHTFLRENKFSFIFDRFFILIQYLLFFTNNLLIKLLNIFLTVLLFRTCLKSFSFKLLSIKFMLKSSLIYFNSAKIFSKLLWGNPRINSRLIWIKNTLILDLRLIDAL